MTLSSLIKSTVKKTPPLLYLKNKVFSYIRREYWHEAQISEVLKIFAPFSGNPPSLVTKLTLLSANSTFPLLEKLMVNISNKSLLKVVIAEQFFQTDETRIVSESLSELFMKYGSDKSKTHNYQLIYGPILMNPEKITKILEIGMGTNNTDVVSNMGVNGKPGASLRAFRDFLPNAVIFGADFDKRILFSEDRIQTYFVDQTNLSTFEELGKNVGTGFDLIIDDALHAPNANLAVLLFAMDRLKPNGWLIIEDIREEAIPLWQVVAQLLPLQWKSHVVAAKGASYVFAVQKRN